MQFVYDFDGVLVDTKNAIRRAWKMVGVDPPKDFWKKSWKDWCPDPELYEKRNEAYIEKCLPLVNLLPMMKVAAATGGLILTNGAQSRVLATLAHFNVKDCIVKCELNAIEKAKELNSLKEVGVYFEDQWENAAIIRKLTQWKVVLIASQS